MTIDLDKYGLLEGHPEKEGIYTAFMLGWALAQKQVKNR